MLKVLMILAISGAGAFVLGVLLDVFISFMFGTNGNPVTYGLLCVAALLGSVVVAWAFDKP